MDEKSDKIFPRNLTARATYQAPGNPVVTRLEDAVGNCYPGLEIDVTKFRSPLLSRLGVRVRRA